MHRFFLPTSECQRQTLLLSGREAHHALHVRRLQHGETVVALDGAGLECRCTVKACRRDDVALTVVERRLHPPLACRITLLQALPKGKAIETIIEQATELGVARIIPVLSERVVTRVESADHARKGEKWQVVAIEALKQCGQVWLPRVEPPVTVELFLKRGEAFDLALVAALLPGSRHAREYFRAFKAEQGRKPGSVALWVGPEGDFTAAEYEAIQGAGAKPVTLGGLVLRSATAAIYGLSVLNHELQAPEGVP